MKPLFVRVIGTVVFAGLPLSVVHADCGGSHGAQVADAERSSETRVVVSGDGRQETQVTVVGAPSQSVKVEAPSSYSVTAVGGAGTAGAAGSPGAVGATGTAAGAGR